MKQYRSLRHIVEQIGKKRARTVIAISSPVCRGRQDDHEHQPRSRHGAIGRCTSAAHRRRCFDGGSLGDQLGIPPDVEPGSRKARSADPNCRLSSVVRRVPRPQSRRNPRRASCPTMPYETLRSPRLGELLQEARENYDYVLLDTPPIVPVADMRVLGGARRRLLSCRDGRIEHRGGLLDEALSAMDPQKGAGDRLQTATTCPCRGRYRYYYNYGQDEPQGALGVVASVPEAGHEQPGLKGAIAMAIIVALLEAAALLCFGPRSSFSGQAHTFVDSRFVAGQALTVALCGMIAFPLHRPLRSARGEDVRRFTSARLPKAFAIFGLLSLALRPDDPSPGSRVESRSAPLLLGSLLPILPFPARCFIISCARHPFSRRVLGAGDDRSWGKKSSRKCSRSPISAMSSSESWMTARGRFQAGTFRPFFLGRVEALGDVIKGFEPDLIVCAPVGSATIPLSSSASF